MAGPWGCTKQTGNVLRTVGTVSHGVGDIYKCGRRKAQKKDWNCRHHSCTVYRFRNLCVREPVHLVFGSVLKEPRSVMFLVVMSTQILVFSAVLH